MFRERTGVKAGVLLCFAATVELTWCLGQTLGTQFTFLLPAGKTECFYQSTLKSWSMEVEYQVIAGAGLDVGFALISPSGYRLVSDFRRYDGIHTVDPTEDGDYRLCFDNSFSKFSGKMVFFEVILDYRGLNVEKWTGAVALDIAAEYELENVRGSLEQVQRRLERSLQTQATLRALEARDRYLLEDNLWRVSFWSCLNLLVMLSVAAAQIYTLRRLFAGNNTVVT